MLPLATEVLVSRAAPSLAGTRFSGADTARGTATVARTVSGSCLPGMGPCEHRGMQVLSTQPVAHSPAEEICLLCAAFVITRKEEPKQGAREEFRLVFYSPRSRL